jgi:hypothetical protein
MRKNRRTQRFATAVAAGLMMMPAVALAKGGKPPPPPPPPPSGPPSPTAVNNQFFSWYETGTPAPPANYIGVPFLTDANAAAVSSYLATAGAVKAVKVTQPISNATANLIFNNAGYNVSYVFGDLEGLNAPAMAQTLVNQVKYVNGTSSSGVTKSNRAWIGNFGFTTQTTNSQAPDDYSTYNGKHSYSGYQYNTWSAAGLNMSNEEVYPGSPSMRQKANYNPYGSYTMTNTPQGSGTYPNIRGALFVLPLWRVGQATDAIKEFKLSGIQHIPWTANFNNWGNLGLDNDRSTTPDGNGWQYTFKPGQAMAGGTFGGKVYPSMTAAQTANQMVSERDFAISMLHMRMRGADSFHLLDSGIADNPATPENEAVSRTQMQSDAVAGWNAASNVFTANSVNTIFAASDKHLLIGPADSVDSNDYSGGSAITVDGMSKNVDQTGAIYSGVYSKSLKKLDILLSNMDDSSHKITLPSTIGNVALAVRDVTLAGGDHLLIDYTIATSGANKGKWVVASQHVPLTAIMNSRNGFGIPEPGTLSLLAVAGVFGLNRRKKASA